MTTIWTLPRLSSVISARAPSCYHTNDKVDRLFPNYRQDEEAYFRKTGMFPIMHITGIKRSIVEKYPWVPINMYHAFNEAKRIAMKRMENPRIVPLAWFRHFLEEQQELLGPDPWVSGLGEINKKALARQPKPLTVEEKLEEARKTLGANADIMVRTLALLSGFAWFTSQGARFGDTMLAAARQHVAERLPQVESYPGYAAVMAGLANDFGDGHIWSSAQLSPVRIDCSASSEPVVTRVSTVCTTPPPPEGSTVTVTSSLELSSPSVMPNCST